MADHADDAGAPAPDSRLARRAQEGCAEARLLMSRRSLMGITAALFSSAVMPDFANADTNPDARLLVVVLRGGMDGINTLVPVLDPYYETARGVLALPVRQLLPVGSDFALHPGLAGVHQMYLDGEAAFVPAAGIPLKNRSHFECQDNLENGLPRNVSNATGWLNRLLGALPSGDPIRTRRGIEIGDAPLILRGPEPVLGWSPTWFAKAEAPNIRRIQALYAELDPALGDSLARGLEADALALSSGAGTGDDLSALRKGFVGAARLLRVETGPRIAVLSIGGWDTHSQQGRIEGELNDRLRDLDTALADLKRELAEVWASTVVVCVTEFGRTIDTNGDRGTDHGIGTVALLAGGAVRAAIHGDWPGLAPEFRHEWGDLRPTVDLRSVFKGIARDHLGVPAEILDTTVFPESADAPVLDGLIAAPERARAAASRFQRPPSLQEVAPIALYRQRYGL